MLRRHGLWVGGYIGGGLVLWGVAHEIFHRIGASSWLSVLIVGGLCVGLSVGGTGVLIWLLQDFPHQPSCQIHLHQAQVRTEILLQDYPYGVWEVSFPDQRVWWSSVLYDIYGVSPETYTPQFRSWVPWVHPDYRETVVAQQQAFLATQSPTMHLEYPILVHAQTRWLRNTGRYVYDAAGVPVFACGIVHDITSEVTFREETQAVQTYFLHQWHVPHHCRETIRQCAGFLGRSPCLDALYDQVVAAAATDLPVLLLGETGTGKELLARTLHTLSDRRESPFRPINCAAIPESLVESELFGYVKGAFTGATTAKAGLLETPGTVFFDELEAVPLALQAKLLRALEYGIRRVGATQEVPLQCRILAASNVDILSRVKEGTFRQDLYYRLAGLPLTIPPLREHREDIPYLIHHFWQEFGTDDELPEELILTWQQAMWPGNVRELRHAVEQYAVFRRWPMTTSARRQTLQSSLAAYERHLIQTTLTACRQNKAEAAHRLGISERTLYRKLST